ncbi:serine protease, partial [Staphylococcus capitis]
VEGIGFAIPSNEVRVTIEQLVKHGKVERPSIGIGLLNLSDIPDSYKKELKTDRDTGVYIAKVSHSSELKVGDIITKVDSKKVDDD